MEVESEDCAYGEMKRESTGGTPAESILEVHIPDNSGDLSSLSLLACRIWGTSRWDRPSQILGRRWSPPARAAIAMGWRTSARMMEM